MKNLSLIVLVVIALYSCTAKKEIGQVAGADAALGDVSGESQLFKDTVSGQRGSAALDDRFSIAGDFNGDGAVDTIYESFISQLTNREMTKVLDEEDYWNNVTLVMSKDPLTRLYSSIAEVDTFVVSSAMSIGVCFFTNLGDLDGELGDEFGYAINWGDASNLNTYHVMTLKEHRLTEIFKFGINEFVSFGEESLFDNGKLVKPMPNKQFVYKFYSDRATVEQAVYSFE